MNDGIMHRKMNDKEWYYSGSESFYIQAMTVFSFSWNLVFDINCNKQMYVIKLSKNIWKNPQKDIKIEKKNENLISSFILNIHIGTNIVNDTFWLQSEPIFKGSYGKNRLFFNFEHLSCFLKRHFETSIIVWYFLWNQKRGWLNVNH